MKILSIHSKSNPTPQKKSDELSRRGVTLLDYSPTLLSAFAAMRISSIIDKEDISVIEVSNIKDAMAATSGRDLARKKHVKIIMNVPPNFPTPKGVAGELRRKIDGWIFPSARLRDTFPDDLRGATVIQTTSFALATDLAPTPHDKPVISWIGDITRPDRLKAFLEEAEATPGDYSLRISGAGDAAKVMPVVRFSRQLARNRDIVWVGEEYDPATEIKGSDAVLASDDDITPTEAAAILSGRHLLQPGELGAFLAGDIEPAPHLPQPEEYISRYLDMIHSLD